MQRFSILSEIVASSGKKEELLDVFKNAARLMATNPDCFEYLVNLSEEHPESIFIFETWQDEESHAGSLGDSRVLEMMSEAKSLMSEVKRLYTFKSVYKDPEDMGE